jgi:hypothetical protein
MGPYIRHELGNLEAFQFSQSVLYQVLPYGIYEHGFSHLLLLNLLIIKNK